MSKMVSKSNELVSPLREGGPRMRWNGVNSSRRLMKLAKANPVSIAIDCAESPIRLSRFS